MLIAHPSSTAFDSLSRIIPHSFTMIHTHPKNSRLESNQVWLEHHLVQFRGHGYSNRFVLCAEVYSFTHTIRTSRPDQGTEGRNEAYSFTSPLKSATAMTDGTHRLSQAHECAWAQLASVLGSHIRHIANNQCTNHNIHRASQSKLAPHRRHLRCTLPPAELWRSWFQNHTKPAAHTTGRVVARYGLFPTAREPILNCQCGQTLGPWIHHTGAPKHPQVTTLGTPGPHRSHKRVFPPFLLTHTKGFSLLTPKIPPSTF